MVESLHYIHFLLLWLLLSLLTGVLVSSFDASGSWPYPGALSVCPSVSLPCACEPHFFSCLNQLLLLPLNNYSSTMAISQSACDFVTNS